MESILEAQRKLHEQRERLSDSITRETMIDKKSHKAAINSEHRIRSLAKQYHGATETLEKLYKDESGERNRENEAIAGPNEFAEFYSRLKSLKDSHKRNPDEPAHCLSVDFQKLNAEIADPEREEPDMVTFTDEEGYGRYLDLHTSHDKYLNLKGIKRTDYISYISAFDKFHEISRNSTKKTGAYKEYLQHLKDYLVDFIGRTRPMLDLSDDMDKAEVDVDRMWNDGSVPGWPDQKQGSLATQAPVPLELSDFHSALDLEGLGMERLKSALQALGLKCGGTLKERAERLFATKGHKLSDLEKAALAKKEGGDKDTLRNKQLAKLEIQIKTLVILLTEEREATKENVERKQARATGENSDEEEDVMQLESDEEEDDSVPYNPKNLPLGWDGKPIPYWLYKLHGLNISYSCEICGNQTYKGPKSFQRHFTEWRHSHSMRCLGIPNTAHFANITKIAEALALWNKIKREKETQKWNAEIDEEYEDSAGNVVNKRVYDDLKRQGLL